MKRPERKTEDNREERTDKLFIARYPDRDNKRPVDPSAFYTVRNKKADLYAPTHNSAAGESDNSGNVFVTPAQPAVRALKVKPKRRARVNKTFVKAAGILMTLSLLAGAFFILRVSLIDVVGVTGAASERITELSGIKKGSPIWLTDLNKAKAGIEADPYIKVGRIILKYPSTVVIEAESREETAAIEYMDTYIVIDREGHVLSIGKRENLDGLIKIRGLRLTGCQVNRNLSEAPDIFISALTDMLGAIEGCSLRDAIEEMDLSNPLSIKLKASGGLCVLIGPPERLEEKLLKLNELLPALTSRELLAGTLDLSAKAEPVYSPPPDAGEEIPEGEEQENENEGQAGG
jgi:hypothetical protein